MTLQYQITPSAILIMVNGELKQIHAANPQCGPIRELLYKLESNGDGAYNVRYGQWLDLRRLFDLAEAMKDYLGNLQERCGVQLNGHSLVVAGGNVTWDGETLGGVVVDRILAFMSAGRPVEPLAMFLARLMANPSYNSRQQLYSFLEALNMPITENGTFLACKGVTAEYKDCHTGEFDNRPGAVNEMPRSKVDENPNNHCSSGFHVGAWEYASSFGRRCVLVEVDPADVVSVPGDHNAQKCRVTKYKVLRDMTEPLRGDFFPLRTELVVAEPATPKHVCPDCGEDLDGEPEWSDDEDKVCVCPECDAEICKACGEKVEPEEASFCSKCGESLDYGS